MIQGSEHKFEKTKRFLKQIGLSDSQVEKVINRIRRGKWVEINIVNGYLKDLMKTLHNINYALRIGVVHGYFNDIKRLFERIITLGEIIDASIIWDYGKLFALISTLMITDELIVRIVINKHGITIDIITKSLNMYNSVIVITYETNDREKLRTLFRMIEYKLSELYTVSKEVEVE